MGGALNDKTIPQLKCQIVAGAANNMLAEPHHDQALTARDILYVPDYVINSGGVICVGYEYFRKSGYNPMDFEFSRRAMLGHVERIDDTVVDILKRAKQSGMNTGEAADKIAEARFVKGAALNPSNDDSNSEDPSNFGSSSGTTLVQ